MQHINRDCLILRAKQSFADWTRSVPGLKMPDATLEDVNLEATDSPRARRPQRL